MTALAKAKPSSVKVVTREKRPLAAGAKVYKGAIAMAVLTGTSRGFYKQGAAATANQTLVAVGRFYEDVDNTSGADGDVSADIHFFAERNLFLVANDAGTPVVAADRESPCQILDDQTATGAKGTNGRLGVVYDVTSEGVWAEILGAYGSGSQNIQSGTGTLVAGTLTVTGVILTSTSRIQLTMKDPGAGALTTFIALDAPVANRNTATGQFVVNAIDNAKATLATAVCTFDWTIVG